MKRPTCAVQVVFEIKAEHTEAFREAVLLQAKNSLEKESWCHQFDVCRLPDQPTAFLLYETYDDRAAFEKHRQTEHFAEFSARIADWVVEKQLGVWDILDD